MLMSHKVCCGVLVICSVTLGACGRSPDASSTSAAPSTGAATVGSVEATAPAETPSAGISPLGNANSEMKTLRPQAPSQLVVTDVRVGKHQGFERIVFEFTGDGEPGWFIDYSDTPTQQGSGKPVAYTGNTALNVNIDGVVYPFELNIDDPNIGTTHGAGGFVTEVVNTGTFEGRCQFIIGMKERHAYSVQTLQNPTRLVIDVLQAG
ncbi:AMIN-like domain-containing (lipo)protein [Corynebacterium flavescens]|uniref:AMIN-like domain-containing (lipo)protein n=1 Tax=Corynebacterium flavescens TaxID=28028 RepID=UPI003F50FC6E